MRVLVNQFEPARLLLINWLPNLYQVGAVLLLVWILFRFISELEDKIGAGQKLKYDQSTAQGIIRILKIFLFFFGGLGVFQALGVPLSGLLAFGGMGGVALGFAAKDLLSNLFGRLMIFLDRQFEIGDWIASPDRQIEGIVEHIGWRLTQVRTLEKRELFIPNSIFSTIILENISRMSRRKMKAHLQISYADHVKMSSILQDLTQMLQNHPAVDSAYDYFANIVEFGPHGLELQIQAYTQYKETLSFQKAQQDILLQALQIIALHGACIARPYTVRD